MRITYIGFIYLLLLPVNKLLAQSKYNIDYITTENGLPSDGITGLQWDDTNHFLWIGTEAGLVRYNGNSFYIFNKENTSFLKDEHIFRLVKDTRGTIFTINAGNALLVNTNKVVFKKIITPGIGETMPMLRMFVTQGPPSGASAGINDYDQYLPIDANTCLIQKRDTLWAYHAGNETKDPLAPLPKGVATFEIGTNVFAFDGQDQFMVYDSSTHQMKTASVSYSNTTDERLPAGKKNLYWDPGVESPVILAGTNAWLLTYKNGNITASLLCTEIPQNYSIKFVRYWQKGDILFLGTTSKGIIIIRKSYLATVRKNRSGFDEPNAIYSQILLSNGNVLANTGDILGPQKPVPETLPVPHAFDNNIFITSDSVLWYSRRDSIYFYDYKTGLRNFYSTMKGCAYLAYVFTDGQLYVANYQGLYLIAKDGLKRVSNYKYVGDPFNMAELAPGVLALASSKGLFRYTISSGKLDTIFLKDAPVRSLWKYGPYLFIGTYGEGIYMLKDGVVKKLPLDNNNYLHYTHCFILDAEGYCWMSTNRGLFKARINDMIDAYEHNTPYVYYHFFGKNEGMEITEMNGGCSPCGIKMQNNDISFPTMDGALRVKPEMPVRLPDGNIYIDQILLNGKREDSVYDNLMLGPGIRDISINIGFSAWCDKENIYIEYYLDPHSKDWQPVTVEHPVIRLNNLTYGKYVLYIRELKGFGPGNYSIRKISFEIQAPWYMEWWGTSLIIFAFLAFITIISVLANRRSLMRQRRLKGLLDKKTKEILKQNEKLEKNDRIKTRLISIISHDIITPLKYLHLTSKYLSERKASLSENLQKETLAEVVNTSRELELLSTNILNWIKYQNEERRIVKETINLHELLEQVFVILRTLASKNNIELVNDIPVNLTVHQFVDPLRIILYNLTVNSINFTQAGSITVSCKNMAGDMQIEVKDTGLGMSTSQINNIMSDHVIISSANVNKKSGHGLGYLIIKDLLKMINGVFYIESKLKAGTSVYIVFPSK